jgi:chitinase
MLAIIAEAAICPSFLTAAQDIYARNYKIDNLTASASKLTHVIYAFANIKSDGEVFLSDPWADTDVGRPFSGGENNLYGSMGKLFQLKKSNRQLKTLLSIGGWSYSANFAVRIYPPNSTSVVH